MCSSFIYHYGTFSTGKYCLSRQLAAVTKERDKWCRLFGKQAGKLNAANARADKAEAELAVANGLLDEIENLRNHDSLHAAPLVLSKRNREVE